MMSQQRWFERPQFRQIVLALAAAAVLWEGYLAIFRRENDFTWHLGLGQRFLAGAPYSGAGGWYPLARTALDGALASIPPRAARAICYVTSVMAWGGILLAWCRLAPGSARLTPARAFAAGTFAMVTLAGYILRDLDECGLQTILLGLLTLTVVALSRQRSVRAGLWLASAVCYKLTPLLGIPFLLWKRRWAPALAACIFVVLLNFLPAIYLGWDVTKASNAQFFVTLRGSLAVDDPSQNVAEPPKPQNQALVAGLSRYLQSHSPGHPLYLEHPLFAQFGNLTPQAAAWSVKAVLLALAGLLAWRWFPRPSDQQPQTLAQQWAAVCILIALLSPLCWKQHLVLALPALLLAWRDVLSQPLPARGRMLCLGIIAAIAIGCRRELLGYDLSIVAMSYKLDTIAVLLTLGLVTTIRPSAEQRMEPSLPLPEWTDLRRAA
jgi:hypothetical protein